ncbi:Transmembrane amino acid transporter [Paratrimastix pyriformis]|uniref:Transmembrane amino acid transporter n=1 Tax=Paratrimastix pyriformis TaxID=342808 RepID=A0ABQ8UQY4_9EUKA|nr:Transmembrane amino acid transporter [Paratrimastix pyriformis]
MAPVLTTLASGRGHHISRDRSGFSWTSNAGYPVPFLDGNTISLTLFVALRRALAMKLHLHSLIPFRGEIVDGEFSRIITEDREIGDILPELSSQKIGCRAEMADVGASFAACVFNLVTSTIGAGVLGLPRAFSCAGMFWAFLLVTGAASLSYLSLHQLSYSANVLKMYTYGDLSNETLGFAGLIITEICNYLMSGGPLWAYIVLMCDFVSRLFEQFVCPDCILTNRAFITALITFGLVLPLCSMKRFNSLRFTSFLGLASMSVAASVIVIRYFVPYGGPGVMCTNHSPPIIFRFDSTILVSFGTLCFAYGCQQNVPSIFGESKGRRVNRFKGIAFTATAIPTTIYFVAGTFGYMSFTDHTEGDVLLCYSSQDPLAIVARICVLTTVLFCCPMNLVPCRVAILNITKYLKQRIHRRKAGYIPLPSNPDLEVTYREKYLQEPVDPAHLAPATPVPRTDPILIEATEAPGTPSTSLVRAASASVASTRVYHVPESAPPLERDHDSAFTPLPSPTLSRMIVEAGLATPASMAAAAVSTPKRSSLGAASEEQGLLGSDSFSTNSGLGDTTTVVAAVPVPHSPSGAEPPIQASPDEEDPEKIVCFKLAGRPVTRETVVRLSLTVLIASLSYVLAVLLPKVEFIFDLIGSTAGVMCAYILPALIYLRVRLCAKYRAQNDQHGGLNRSTTMGRLSLLCGTGLAFLSITAGIVFGCVSLVISIMNDF